MYTKDTIAAVSTPPGQGGIGIVRVSGERAFNILERIFKPKKEPENKVYGSHTVHYGHIADPVSSMLIDEVLVTVMKAPNTYTRENILEINCHGGESTLRSVLSLCLKEGARLAEPGEFTKRAFLNGRLDLSQAEAVLDIIVSSSDASCRIAVDHLKGEFSRRIKMLRSEMLNVTAEIELSIDFSQEDVEFTRVENMFNKIKEISLKLQDLLKTADKGLILRNGASVVICGRPNVGKSSLMNALLKHDRVIVTPVAGTTRDVVEESIDLDGLRVRISDTAGIIETKDRVELEGIRRSKEKLEKADLVVFLMDSSRELSDKDKEIFETIKNKTVVIAANKIDLKNKLDFRSITRIFNQKILKVSVLKKQGLEKLEDEIKVRLFQGDPIVPDGPIVNNVRHKMLIEDALGALNRVMRCSGETFTPELAANDLNEAIYALGAIMGESVDTDILDRIFSQYCIGK